MPVYPLREVGVRTRYLSDVDASTLALRCRYTPTVFTPLVPLLECGRWVIPTLVDRRQDIELHSSVDDKSMCIDIPLAILQRRAEGARAVFLYNLSAFLEIKHSCPSTY